MQLSLMSLEFLGLSFAAAVLLAVLAGNLRQTAFFAANITFVWVLLLGPRGTLSTVVFCLLGYLLTRFIIKQPRLGFAWALGVYVLLFIYMRNYNFLHWVLPEGILAQSLGTVGLSFLFFKVVHVMIEARSGTLGRLEFATYLNYCFNFTTFMMGPIQRYQDFYQQLHSLDHAVPLRLEAHIDAVLRIMIGFFKAYVVAEWLSQFALTDGVHLLARSPLSLLLSIYAFYFFLYFNFAGYCDVVIGVGSLLGIRPPENFDKPFLARNISEFWLRFHRSLTNWLTDYVFSPIYKWALNKSFLASRPLLSLNVALLLTMLVSGLWHGTTLNFLLFGLAHGSYFMIFRTWDTLLTRKLGKQRNKEMSSHWGVRLVAILLTFNAVALSLVFFRLDADRALQVIARLGGL